MAFLALFFRESANKRVYTPTAGFTHTSLDIGDDNTFREHVTVHRGTAHTGKTQIGSRNFFMAGSHIAHDCRIGNRCILANGALVGGHCEIEDGVYLSGNCAIHQFVSIGRLALLTGCSFTTKDIPPFVVQQGINSVVGINVAGMRRAGMTKPQIDGVHRAFHILYRQGRTDFVGARSRPPWH